MLWLAAISPFETFGADTPGLLSIGHSWVNLKMSLWGVTLCPLFLAFILSNRQRVLQRMDQLRAFKRLKDKTFCTDFNRFIDCIVIGE